MECKAGDEGHWDVVCKVEESGSQIGFRARVDLQGDGNPGQGHP